MLRVNARVLVIEPSDVPERNDVVLGTVDPGAAVLFRSQRIAHRVNHFAGSYAPTGNFPEFFDAYAIGLRVTVVIEVEALNQLLGARSAGSLGKDGDLGL